MTKKHSIKLPITNHFAMGDYTTTLFLGSEQQPVNLILDTGSSTLVVTPDAYQAMNDKTLKPTSFAQEVNYGIGGWDGPVINSQISIGHDNEKITLKNTHLAIVSTQKQNSFGQADGILGLAYHHLNKSYDLAPYLQENNISPAHTYPWPFDGSKGLIDSSDLKAFKKLLRQHPEQDIKPYFTELEEHNLTANKFAFFTQRSSIYYPDKKQTTNKLADEPLNSGWLILGGGEEYKDLYQGRFQHINIFHDIYYNAKLISVQVGDNPEIPASAIDAKHQASYFTNAIIDTGASGLILTNDIYQQIIVQLSTLNPEFENLVAPFKNIAKQSTGIDSKLLSLELWPDIHFIFEGERKGEGKNNNQVRLTCPPQCYWQLNTPSSDKACFKILAQLPQWPNQSIIGLPLLNNYYVVFDRSEHKTGIVKFAKQKQPKG